MERRLGRGLGSLLGPQDSDEGAPPPGTHELPVRDVRPNPKQPRKVFDSARLEELRDSIREHGVIQPICVRRVDEGYEIISGERRWRAARLAGLETVPAVVRRATDDEAALELALVENLQRQDLDPIEKARGYKALVDEHDLTQDQVAKKVGLKRATIANHLRLLELPEEAREAVASGLVTMGHARALLALEGPKAIQRALGQVVRADLSVRQTEALVREEVEAKEGVPSGGSSTVRPAAPWLSELESRMRDRLGVRVTIQNGPGYRGRIVVQYSNRSDLERLCDVLAPKDTL